MTVTTDAPTPEVLAAIARGDLVTLRQAADRMAIGYWTIRRRLRRESVPTLPLRGRVYVAVADLENPALRVA